MQKNFIKKISFCWHLEGQWWKLKDPGPDQDQNVMDPQHWLPGSNQFGGHLSQLELVVLRLRERLPKLFPNLNYAEL